MRPYFEKDPAAAPLPYVANVSWPRSGHHLLMRLLSAYFGPRFGYCEYHGPRETPEIPCCGAFPCRKRGLISMSKNHDFDLSSPVPTGCAIIVQWREPLAAIQSEFELALRAGQEDTAASFAAFAEKRASAYRRFMAKWLEAPIENRLAVEYDELVADPRSILADALTLWGEVEPDTQRLSEAIATVPHVSVSDRAVHVRDGIGVRAERRVEAFRHYDPALFDRIREIALGKAVAPFRRSTAPHAVERPVNVPAGAPGHAAATTPSDPAAAPKAPAGPAKQAAPEAGPKHQLRHGERLILLHIPKCAGSSLSAMLASNFRPAEVFAHRDDVLPGMRPEEIKKYRYFTGHFSKHGIDAVPGPKRVVTVLREPRERVLSLYHFWRSHRPEVIERQNLIGPKMARELSLVEFLKCDRPEVVASINNHLVRVMLGPVKINESQGFRLEDREYCVETAVLNLQRFNFVAFSDTLEEDVPAMMSVLGLAPAESVPTLKSFDKLKQNSANFEAIERESPTEEAWDWLNRLTYLDMAFYKRARDLRHTLRCPYPM